MIDVILFRKQILDDMSCVNRHFLVIELGITIREQYFYDEIDMIAQNVGIKLGNNVTFHINDSFHRAPRYGSKNHDQTLSVFNLWQQTIPIVRL